MKMDITGYKERSIILPPETLHHICKYVIRHDSQDSILDLLAFALVKKDWYDVASPLLEKPLCKLRYTKPYSITRRLAAILLESHHYVPEICKKITFCEIDVDEYIAVVLNNDNKPRNPYNELFERAKPEDVEALFNIIRLTDIRKLNIIVGYPGGSEARLREREMFFKRLSESITIVAITNLEVNFFKEWYQPNDQPSDFPLAALLRAMSKSITDIKLQWDPDMETVSALASLPILHKASIFLCPIRKATIILRGAPHISVLNIESLSGDGADSLLACIAPANLEVLTITSVPDKTNDDLTLLPVTRALEDLIASAPRLSRLYLLQITYVTNDVVRAAALHCRYIEHVCLPATTGLDGNGVWNNQIRPWPELRFILTTEPMTTEFVNPILEKCTKLECVAFGDAGDGGDERVEMFEGKGFKLTGQGWSRVMN